MSLHYIYSDAPLSTIDITDRCRVDQLQVKEQAEEGAVPISSLIIDDPEGDLLITGHRRLYIYEDTAPVDNQVIYDGFTANERVGRGPYKTGAGRQWTVDLADPDVLINRRIMNGTDANRPEETDTERIVALMGMTELNTVDDDTYVNLSASTVAMDACDYRGQNVGAYIDDCRQASGKNAYILYNEPLGEFGLWYDFATSTEYDSECFLTTDELQEVDFETVFAISQERTYLNMDPSRVASGIYLEFDGPDSPVYVQDEDTIDAFAAIDWPAPSLNVKSLAKATARANRYLGDAKTEDPIIHVVMTKVPRDKVNVVLKGQLVQFKAEWMPGYEEYTTCRVLYRTVTEITEDPTASFEIEMDLSPMPVFVCSVSSIAENSSDDGLASSGALDIAVPAPSAPIGVIVGAMDLLKHDTNIGPDGDSIAVAAPWTEMSGHNATGYDHIMTKVAYLPITGGSAADWEASWVGRFDTGPTTWGFLSVAVATAATTPIQSWTTTGPAAWPATPIEGDLLLMAIIGRDDFDTITLLNWTEIVTLDIPANPGIADPGRISFWVRCAGPDEGGAEEIYSHSGTWTTLSEWPMA